ERQEVRRVLAALSTMLAPYRLHIQNNAKILGHLDFVNAKAKMAHDTKATLPLLSQAGQVVLKKARHPLIDP
ncbi:hypothetical protein NE699_25770, partial [Escherichia coli]|nr:hypothetical protein [Escherichia coli]